MTSGLVAVVVGGVLAVATMLGIVQSQEASPENANTQVVDYGSR